MTVKVIELVFIIVILIYPNAVILSTNLDFLDDNDEITIFDEIPERRGFTLPGTKWCGPGNTAENEHDLGSFPVEDSCCRDHDKCDNIEPGGMKRNLSNPDIFTRLHCQCEKDFQRCLRGANSILGFAIGHTYTTVRKYCYKFEYPIKECIKYQEGFLQNRCIRYKLDMTKPKSWQWFEIPFY